MSSVRVDSWIFAVRITKTRASAAAACRAGHVRVNGVAVKPAQLVSPGDEVRVKLDGRERIVKVLRPIAKRVGAPVVPECLIDRSPPPPAREAVPVAAVRDRGAGRPTKRERRQLDQLRGR